MLLCAWQKAPSRGNVDAVNVHPFEFITGEYNHLFAVYVVSRFLLPLHCITILAFIVVGGFLASLNHTRFDIRFPLLDFVYQVRFHDHHHVVPNSNYGQYIMLWDHVFGSFKPYPEAAKTQ
jgi:sterol desaturase/sphingolipid hydroxylase (fatty acid hydroxylase superfamily)